MNKLLFYFTASHPYGIGESWKRNELDVLVRHFEDIVVCPFTDAGNSTPKNVPAGVKVRKPLMTEPFKLKQHASKIITGGNLRYYLKEFRQKKVFLSKSLFVSWLVASIQTEIAWRSDTVKLILTLPKDTSLYFFWAREWAYIVPLLSKRGYENTVIRFHGYDLYEERNENGGYIPYRPQLLRSLHNAVMLSQSAETYLKSKYTEIPIRSVIIPLGACEAGKAMQSTDSVLRIVTCSSVVPLKRLNLLAKALQNADIPVEWTHIGDGPLMAELQELASQLPKNVTVKFTGQLKTEDVVGFYHGKKIDLFVNISETEGLPVSIIEAFSAEIPAIATNVGGSAALVNQKTGILIPKDITPEELWKILFDFYNLTPERKADLRRSAYELFCTQYDAVKNAEKLALYLRSPMISREISDTKVI